MLTDSSSLTWRCTACAFPRERSRHPEPFAYKAVARLTTLGDSRSINSPSLVIYSALSRDDRGDYFCPQSGAIDDHAPSPGSVHRRAECLLASAGPLFPNPQSGRDGQFRSVNLGYLIAGRGGPNGAPCTLSDVRIYSGEPDARRDPRTYAAHRRQAHRWASDGATVITRSLRYPRGWPAVAAQEKGIDVALAVDFVKLASRAITTSV